MLSFAKASALAELVSRFPIWSLEPFDRQLIVRSFQQLNIPFGANQDCRAANIKLQ
jgi:hypothetical protein